LTPRIPWSVQLSDSMNVNIASSRRLLVDAHQAVLGQAIRQDRTRVLHRSEPGAQSFIPGVSAIAVIAGGAALLRGVSRMGHGPHGSPATGGLLDEVSLPIS
jgi:hypothetical protein